MNESDQAGRLDGALKGTRVIDLTQVIFGPSCTQILADHGADVVKVERPNGGDLARDFGPWLNGQSLPFASVNRSKRSLAVDLKRPEGVEIIHRLLSSSDVLAHNYRPGVMERLGLGFEELHHRFPRLIYAAATGYGLRGPYADKGQPGHDTEVQALCGVVASNPGPGGVPKPLPLPVADFPGGMLLAHAILLALIARERTGMGQLVETSLMDAVIAMQAWGAVGVLNKEALEEQDGQYVERRHPLDGAVFSTSNGHIMVSALFRPHPQPLRDLCLALETRDLSSDPRFLTFEGLLEQGEDLLAELKPLFATRTTEEWVKRLDERGILCAPIRTLEEALNDPQLAVDGLLVEVEHADYGKARLVGSPLRLYGTPTVPSRFPPCLGQHTNEILLEAGYEKAEINDLRSRQVIR